MGKSRVKPSTPYTLLEAKRDAYYRDQRDYLALMFYLMLQPTMNRLYTKDIAQIKEAAFYRVAMSADMPICVEPIKNLDWRGIRSEGPIVQGKDKITCRN